MSREDDWRYSDEAHRRDLLIIWKCDKCGNEQKNPPGYNEGGQCYCGGTYQESGESYLAEPRW